MVPARRPVAALTPVGLVELVHLDDIPQFDTLDQKLRDPVAAPDADRLDGVQIDEIDLDLSPVPRVNSAG